MKKVLSVMLSLVMLFGVISAIPFTTSAQEADIAGNGADAELSATGGLSLQGLKAKFPEGAYWNHVVTDWSNNGDQLLARWDDSFADSTTSSPCATHNGTASVGQIDCNVFQGAMQCMGFARKISYDAYGSSCKDWGTVNVWDCKRGDVIHYYGGGADADNGHWVMVVNRSGNTLTFGECNAGGRCLIRWSRTLDISSFSSATCYSAPYELPISNEKTGVNIGDDFFALILNGPAWKPIGQTDSGNVQIMTESKTNYNRTLWHFIRRNNNNAYRIYNVLNGKCLDVSGASSAEGANVQCWDANDSQAQYWYYQVKGDAGAFTAGCTDMYLDMYNGSSSDGTNIQMWSWNGTNAQKYSFYKVAEGSSGDFNYTIQADKTKLEEGGSTDITIGNVSYAYSYKFHIIDPSGKETVVDNGGNPVYHFTPSNEGKYIIFAEVKKPYKTKTGSKDNLSVTITVGCEHNYSAKFVPASGEGQQGYIQYTCSKCTKSYNGNYMDYKDGWYTPTDGSSAVPDLIKNDSAYTVQYKSYSEKVQKDSPGEGWVNAGVAKTEYVNKGGVYESESELATSETRVLVRAYYYHFCIPGAGINSEGNYEQSGSFQHYDEINTDGLNVTWTGNDNGHTVYVVERNGSTLYCQSGVTCDGSWGTHGQRCKAWYKHYVYQDKEKVVYYKWVKDTGWTDSADTGANKTEYRFRLTAEEQPILGDADGDGEVAVTDATWIQRKLANLNVVDTFNEKAADVDGNGEVAVTDATWIQRKLANLNIPYMIGEKLG